MPKKNNDSTNTTKELFLPEITLKGMILGILLAMLLAASTCYLGLKVGRTIAASIPASVITIAVFSLFRRNNILENNITQTVASAADAVAAGSIFVLPALVMVGYWERFNYFQSFLIIVGGGILGVMFCIPLRRALIIEKQLPYPEGIATAEVLLAKEQSTIGISQMFKGALVSSIIALLQSAFKIASDSLTKWVFVSKTAFGFSLGLSPILFAAGYIVGLGICVSFGLGSILTWMVGMPLYGMIYGFTEYASAQDAVTGLYETHFRYIGVGAMAVGGIWSMINFIPDIARSMKESIKAMRSRSIFDSKLRTEQDIPPFVAFFCILIVTICIFYTLTYLLKGLYLTDLTYAIVLFVMLIGVIVICFICSGISAYLTGILGSTSLPGSGITLTAIFLVAFPLFYVISNNSNVSPDNAYLLDVAGLTLMIAAFVCIATSVSSDNMQDLKAGYLVGSTPWKQQFAIIIGTVASALVVVPVLNLLLDAYGIGDIKPMKVIQDGNEPLSGTLAAPQATLMATVTKGIFFHTLEFSMVTIGGIMALSAIFANYLFKVFKLKFRISILSFAAGAYLPMSFIMAFVVGGLIHYLGERKFYKKHGDLNYDEFMTQKNSLRQKGILVASGIIAGEALTGVALAAPFAFYGTDDVFAYNMGDLSYLALPLGIVATLIMSYMLYAAASKISARKN